MLHIPYTAPAPQTETHVELVCTKTKPLSIEDAEKYADIDGIFHEDGGAF